MAATVKPVRWRRECPRKTSGEPLEEGRDPCRRTETSHGKPMSRRLAAGIATILALGTAGLSVCSGSPPSAGASPVTAPSVVTPLATSIETAAGTWATVPMGRLDQPPNTFWQLLFLPTGTSSWSDQVEATAVATNGGLVLAAGGPVLLVGVRPSNRLTFSPLIASSDAGRTWSDGLLSEGLAEHPQALAVDDTGRAVALVGGRGEGLTRVLLSAAGLSRWQTLTTASHLAAVPGAKACGLGQITAVSLLAGSPVVGASCDRAWSGSSAAHREVGADWTAITVVAVPWPRRSARDDDHGQYPDRPRRGLGWRFQRPGGGLVFRRRAGLAHLHCTARERRFAACLGGAGEW